MLFLHLFSSLVIYQNIIIIIYQITLYYKKGKEIIVNYLAKFKLLTSFLRQLIPFAKVKKKRI